MIFRFPTTHLFFLGLAFSTALGCGGAPEHSGALDDETTTATTAEAFSNRFRVSLKTPRNLMGGQRGTFYFQVSTSTRQSVTTFEVEHTKLFHLIVVSRDLSYFTHIHPTNVGNGRFGVNWTPPEFDDEYHLYAQFKPVGSATQTVLLPLHVPGTSIKTPVPLQADTVDTKRSGQNVLEIDRPVGGFAVGQQTLHFTVRDASTNRVANDLGAYLGARAHLIAVKNVADGHLFIHGHDMGDMTGMDGMSGMDDMGGSSSSDGSGHLSFDVNLKESGLYRLWIQYNRGGVNVTQSFTVEVAKAGHPTCNYNEAGKSYVGHSPDECSRIRFMCVTGTTYFANDCGCGCETVAGGGHH